MGTRLTTPLCFSERFEFVFHIEENAGGKRTVCRAEIFERSRLAAVVELMEDVSRTEIAEIALQRCLRWAELRIRQVPF